MFQPLIFGGVPFLEANTTYNVNTIVGGWTNPFEKYVCPIGSYPQGFGGQN